ncbi:unnamed protein product [Rhizoctonia solani]|uniref:XPG-I domain-containing protein n=1 Tax=Rhizoctonia solani TaxID=456999 RepID=A0A8H2XIX4_9AGAM|nr:unnamed protein product [Rhizoctonia solani]
MQAQARGAWEKSRHERLLSLTQTLRGLEDMPIEHQEEVLKTLQTDSHLLQEREPSVAISDLIEASQNQANTIEHLGRVSDSHVNLSTGLSLDGIKPDQTFGGDPSRVESGILLGTPSGSEQAIKSAMEPQSHINTIDTDVTMPKETVVQNASEVALSTKPSLSEQLHVTRACNSPKVEADEHHELKLGTLETTESPSSLSEDRVRASLDLTGAESSVGNTEGLDNFPEYGSVPHSTEIKQRIDSLQNESNKALVNRIFGLFDHYNRTTASGSDGTISALSATTDVQDIPTIPISKIQLKYAQEEAKIWKQLVTSSDSVNVDLARVAEMVEQFASVELHSDEMIRDQTMLEEEIEPSISERSAKLEEQSGIMAASLARRANPPTALTYAESRLILEAMGIPCIQSYLPYEAEALACGLVLHGLADFVGSEDTDVLMYNAPLLRNLTKRNVPLQVIPPSVETYLGLSRAAFMDAAILMGTDFVRRVGGIGPSTAWRLMHKYGSIEVMLEQEPKFRPSDIAEYLEQVKVAREIFSTIPPAPAAEDVLPGHWDEQAVYDVMSRFGLQQYLEDTQTIPGALATNYYTHDPEFKIT